MEHERKIKQIPASYATTVKEVRHTHTMKNKRLKIARIECDLKQEDLARMVGVTRQTIGLIENGDYNPSLRLCVAICKATHKTLNDLFWEEETDEEK